MTNTTTTPTPRPAALNGRCRCEVCGAPVQLKAKGRMPKYCGAACKALRDALAHVEKVLATYQPGEGHDPKMVMEVASRLMVARNDLNRLGKPRRIRTDADRAISHHTALGKAARARLNSKNSK